MSRHEPKSRPGSKLVKETSLTWEKKIRRWRKSRNRQARLSRRRNRR